jgi:S1-C subfamily serine protease
VEIVSVEDRSPARRADIQAGDFIVAVNNQPVISVDDIYHFLLLDPQLDKPLKVSVIRRTQRMDLAITPQEIVE